MLTFIILVVLFNVLGVNLAPSFLPFLFQVVLSPARVLCFKIGNHYLFPHHFTLKTFHCSIILQQSKLAPHRADFIAKLVSKKLIDASNLSEGLPPNEA